VTVAIATAGDWLFIKGTMFASRWIPSEIIYRFQRNTGEEPLAWSYAVNLSGQSTDSIVFLPGRFIFSRLRHGVCPVASMIDGYGPDVAAVDDGGLEEDDEFLFHTHQALMFE